MSSPTFFRSTHFLERDNFTWSLLGFVFIAALIVAWIVWFFFAQLTIYEVSQNARLESESQVVADFPPKALIHIQPEQSAQLRFHDFPWTEYGTVSAIVTRVEYKDGRAQVRLNISPEPNSRIPFQRDMTGSVVVAVSKVSPATLVLQTVAERLGQSDKPDEQQDQGGTQE